MKGVVTHTGLTARATVLDIRGDVREVVHYTIAVIVNLITSLRGGLERSREADVNPLVEVTPHHADSETRPLTYSALSSEGREGFVDESITVIIEVIAQLIGGLAEGETLKRALCTDRRAESTDSSQPRITLETLKVELLID